MDTLGNPDAAIGSNPPFSRSIKGVMRPSPAFRWHVGCPASFLPRRCRAG